MPFFYVVFKSFPLEFISPAIYFKYVSFDGLVVPPVHSFILIQPEILAYPFPPAEYVT